MAADVLVEKIEDLLKDQAIPGAGNNSWWIDPLLIHEEDGFNPRNYDASDIQAHIEKLKNAYKNGEYIEPWHVQAKDGKIYVRDGHCRRRALLQAMDEDPTFQPKRIHVIEFRGGAAQQSLLILTSNSGKSLTPLEKGKIFSRLLNYGWSLAEVAEKTGCSEISVRQLSAMCKLPVFLQEQIQNNKISSSLANYLFDSLGGDKSISIISDILKYHSDQEISKKITKKMVQSFLDMDLNDKEKQASFPSKKPSNKVTIKMQNVLSEISGLFENVTIQEDENVFISIPGNLVMQIIAMSEEMKAA